MSGGEKRRADWLNFQAFIWNIVKTNQCVCNVVTKWETFTKITFNEMLNIPPTSECYIAECKNLEATKCTFSQMMWTRWNLSQALKQMQNPKYVIVGVIDRLSPICMITSLYAVMTSFFLHSNVLFLHDYEADNTASGCCLVLLCLKLSFLPFYKFILKMCDAYLRSWWRFVKFNILYSRWKPYCLYYVELIYKDCCISDCYQLKLTALF